MLPEVNPREKIEIVETLKHLSKRYKKKRGIKRFYSNRYIIIEIIVFIIILGLTIYFLSLLKPLTFEFSIIFSILAFIFSFITLISRVRG